MTHKTDYTWIELAALLPNGKMVRDRFVRVDDFGGITKWRSRFNNRDIFSSICIYAESNYKAKSIAPIFFDIDSADSVPATRESAITLCEMLMDRVSVPQDSLEIYFSGNKGFHILIPCELFRAFYSPHILGLYKRMAEKAEKQGVRFIDKVVYSKRRIWRLPNSINSKSGLFKILLTYEELRDMDIAGIMKLAEAYRPDDTFVTPAVCEKAAEWYLRAIECVEKNVKAPSIGKINKKFKKGWRMPPCIKTIEASVVPDGIRHKLYLSLARYYGYLNMHHEEIVERLEAIDQRHPIRDPDSIERAIKFGCEHPGFPGCDDPALQKYCRKERCFYAKLKASVARNAYCKEIRD